MWQVYLTENFWEIGLNPANWGNWGAKVQAWIDSYNASQSGFVAGSPCIVNASNPIGTTGEAYVYISAVAGGDPGTPPSGEGCTVSAITPINNIPACNPATIATTAPGTGLCTTLATTTGVDVCGELKTVGKVIFVVLAIVVVIFLFANPQTLKAWKGILK